MWEDPPRGLIIGGGAVIIAGDNTFTGDTQVLSGSNDYTGATSVDEGTLALVGGSHASPITVASGASLAFTLGSSVTSTAALDPTSGTVKITSTPDGMADYQLMTAWI